MSAGTYENESKPVAERRGGRWGVWCTSRHGSAWLKRLNDEVEVPTWRIANFAESGAKDEAARLNDRADMDRMLAGQVPVTRRYVAQDRG